MLADFSEVGIRDFADAAVQLSDKSHEKSQRKRRMSNPIDRSLRRETVRFTCGKWRRSVPRFCTW